MRSPHFASLPAPRVWAKFFFGVTVHVNIPTMALTALLSALGGALVEAKQVGVNAPAQALTSQRVATLSPPQRELWVEYLARSHSQGQADRAALAAERSSISTIPPMPDEWNRRVTMPLAKDTGWYASAEALRVADNIVSFQTPAGGWGKNQARDRPARQKGQAFVIGGGSPFTDPDNFDASKDAHWSYVGTIDNDATITEIRFLAKVAAAVAGPLAATYRASAIRGLEYLLSAQFPNGGWPQVWPLQGGYHDAYTMNDDAIVEVAQLLGRVAQGRDGFTFLPPALQQRVRDAEQRAIASLLATQVVVGGRKALWAQQYDALTLVPTSARNYEPAALSVSESAGTLDYLMTLPAPSPAMVEAIEGGVATLRVLAIEGKVWRKVGEKEGRLLVNEPGAPRIWARYYAIDTLQPVFGDRDKTLHDDVADISLERRNGYAWFGTRPQKTLDAYERWKSAVAPKP